MKGFDWVVTVIVVFVIVIIAVLGLVIYYDAKDAGMCEGLGGVYVEQTCIDRSAVIKLTKG